MQRLLAAVFVALALSVSGLSIGPVSAQQVPVMGEDGWILPENDDDPPFFMVPGPAPATEPVSAPQAAPAPAPAAPAAVQGGYGYYGVVADAAIAHGLSPDYLWWVVGCETGFTYRLDLPGPNGEYGPFQFMKSTFYWLAGLSGYGGSWYSAYDQARVAAWAFANGYASHWVCR